MDPTPAPSLEGSSRTKHVVQLALLVHALVLVALLLRALVGSLTSVADVALAVLGAVLGLVVADLVSGIAHWLLDTYGTEHTPFVGPRFIKLFRVHHDDPLLITRTGFVQINGDSAMLAGGYMLAIIGLRALGVGPTGVLTLAAAIGFGVAITFTNLLHQWSHRTDAPPLARLLQGSRLALRPSAHARHHAPPYRTHYCITFGWLNPLLDRIGFFRRLEAAIRWVLRTRTYGGVSR